MIIFQNENVTVFQSALFQTNSTVVDTEDCILVVDPTWLPHEIKEIQAHVAAIQNNKPIFLYFTHGDFDHIIGYNSFPDAKTIGSIDLKNHPEKEIKLSKIHQFYNDNYITPDYPIEFPEVDYVIHEDGQKLEIGKTTFTFFNSPGHTKDGLFLLIEELGIWITGDYLSNFELPFAYYSVKDYFSTLDKSSTILKSYPISLLIPGHGTVSTDVVEMERRIGVAKDFLSRLKNAVLHKDETEINNLEKEILFPSDFTRYCHQTNIELIKKEY